MKTPEKEKFSGSQKISLWMKVSSCIHKNNVTQQYCTLVSWKNRENFNAS